MIPFGYCCLGIYHRYSPTIYRDNPASIGVISCWIHVKETVCWSEWLRRVRNSITILVIYGYLLTVIFVGRFRIVSSVVVGRSTYAWGIFNTQTNGPTVELLSACLALRKYQFGDYCSEGVIGTRRPPLFALVQHIDCPFRRHSPDATLRSSICSNRNWTSSRSFKVVAPIHIPPFDFVVTSRYSSSISPGAPLFAHCPTTSIVPLLRRYMLHLHPCS